ncbi:hypothetical protein TRIP_C60022 [Candidatus Zixiibacteriota bacterium]|nr:hypothetical protein TRIP_C60022 [candidate division Zixibacteria bacterium]
MSSEIIANLKSFIERGIQLLLGIDPTQLMRLRPTLKQRVKIESPHSTSLHEELVPDYLILFEYISRQLCKGDEFEGFKQRVESDPVIGPHMNTLVGTSESASRLTAEDLLRGFLWEYLVKTKYSTIFDSAVFNSTCMRYSNAFSSSVVNISYKAIIENFKMTEIDKVEVAPGLSIRGLDSTEVEDLWNNNLILQQLYPFSGLGAPVTSISAVLETTRQTAKRIGNIDPESRAPIPTPGVDVRADFDRVITALRMMNSGGVRAGLLFAESNSPWFMGGSTWVGTPFPNFFAQTYEFDTLKDLGLLKSLFNSIKSAEDKHSGALLVGIRRIGFSNERQQDEDKLLDLMIALEAFNLNEVGSPQERGELRFRLALYTAKFLGGDARQQRLIYNLVRKAYDLRSKVVHGEAFNQEQRNIVNQIAEIARTVGRNLLDLHQNGTKPDWEKLLGFKE